jgi:hypothetical protein
MSHLAFRLPGNQVKIVATLAWYKEPPEMLARMTRSLAGVADELIAVDGRWRFFDDASDTALSSDAEVEAIERAADEIGLPRMIIRMDRVWNSQVEKRSFMCQAGIVADATWLFVIDADEYVEKADMPALRDCLSATDLDVAMVMHKRGAPALQSPSAIRRIYRASTGVGVETAHMGYRTRDGRWLHGDHAFVNTEPALDLSSYLTLSHPVLGRSPERLQMREDYCYARRHKQFERWPASVAVRA